MAIRALRNEVGHRIIKWVMTSRLPTLRLVVGLASKDKMSAMEYVESSTAPFSPSSYHPQCQLNVLFYSHYLIGGSFLLRVLLS